MERRAAIISAPYHPKSANWQHTFGVIVFLLWALFFLIAFVPPIFGFHILPADWFDKDAGYMLDGY